MATRVIFGTNTLIKFFCKSYVGSVNSYLCIAAWIAFWIASGVNQFFGITYCINLFVGIIYWINLLVGIVSQPVPRANLLFGIIYRVNLFIRIIISRIVDC